MKQTVMIKGNAYGLVVMLDKEAPFEDILKEVAVKFRDSAKFFKNAKMAVSFEGRKLSPEEQQQLIETITDNSTITVVCVLDKDEELSLIHIYTFHTEDALVRAQITCGTHALHLALSSNLRPGDELLSPVGKPYDTLEEVIGIRPSAGSLREYGVTYRQVDLLSDGTFDYEGIREALSDKTRLVTIQRSKGYASRPSFRCV